MFTGPPPSCAAACAEKANPIATSRFWSVKAKLFAYTLRHLAGTTWKSLFGSWPKLRNWRRMERLLRLVPSIDVSLVSIAVHTWKGVTWTGRSDTVKV